MKTLYLDCSMGAAGDMLAAALLELSPDPEAVLNTLNACGLDGVRFARETVMRGGLAATRLIVRVNGQEEGEPSSDPHQIHHAHHAHDGHHAHHAHHAHDAHHTHHAQTPHAHHGLEEILHRIEGLALPEKVKADAAAVYRALAEAESRAHGRPVGEVHFHEVGALDAVADVAAVCYLMATLAPDEVVASPVHVGMGTVRCAHGVLSVPAPATAFLLEGIPAYADGSVTGELCTPTGAALLRHFVKRFAPLPLMRVTATGFGAGKKDFVRANLLRATWGDSGWDGGDDVFEIACTVDDMTGEDIAYACERLAAAGARDVVLLSAQMKKGRPGTIIQAWASPADRAAVVAAFFAHTSTLGVREHLCRRSVLTRREETMTLADGETVRRKISDGYGVHREKVAHDDLERLARARGVSLETVRADVATSLKK